MIAAHVEAVLKVFFNRKGRRIAILIANILRPLRNLCVPCGKITAPQSQKQGGFFMQRFGSEYRLLYLKS